MSAIHPEADIGAARSKFLLLAEAVEKLFREAVLNVGLQDERVFSPASD